MIGQKNISQIVVGKDVALLAETETRADLVAGKIGVFKNGSTTAINGTTDLTAGDKFKIVFMNVDGNIIESPVIDYDLIKNKNARNYETDVEQKTFVGYNGTTGSLTVNNSADYYIHLFRRDFSATYGEHDLYKLAGGYKSDATATQTEIADGLAVSIDKNFEVEKRRSGTLVTKIGRINSATVTAANALDNDATVVDGQKTFSVATAVTYNTGTALAVGDYVRIGSVGGGTALTSDVYKVTAIDSLVVTVDRIITNAAGTYATATDDIEVIPSATAIAADWGLYFQSMPTKFQPGLFKYQKITFEVSLSEAFGTTLVTESAKAYKGSGTYEEVAEMEWFLNGNRGENFRVATYPVAGRTLNAVSTKNYDSIVLEYRNANSTDLDSDVLSFMSLVIYTEDESSSTVHTQLKDVLNIS